MAELQDRIARLVHLLCEPGARAFAVTDAIARGRREAEGDDKLKPPEWTGTRWHASGGDTAELDDLNRQLCEVRCEYEKWREEMDLDRENLRELNKLNLELAEHKTSIKLDTMKKDHELTLAAKIKEHAAALETSNRNHQEHGELLRTATRRHQADAAALRLAGRQHEEDAAALRTAEGQHRQALEEQRARHEDSLRKLTLEKDEEIRVLATQLLEAEDARPVAAAGAKTKGKRQTPSADADTAQKNHKKALADQRVHFEARLRAQEEKADERIVALQAERDRQAAAARVAATDKALALAEAQSERDAAVAQAQSEHNAALARVQKEHDLVLGRVKNERDLALAWARNNQDVAPTAAPNDPHAHAALAAAEADRDRWRQRAKELEAEKDGGRASTEEPDEGPEVHTSTKRYGYWSDDSDESEAEEID